MSILCTVSQRTGFHFCVQSPRGQAFIYAELAQEWKEEATAFVQVGTAVPFSSP